MGAPRAERRGELRDGHAARRTARRATRWTRSAPNGAESYAMDPQRAERRGERRDGRAARRTARRATRWARSARNGADSYAMAPSDRYSCTYWVADAVHDESR